MADLLETSTFPEGVYRLETTDPVVGGEDGAANRAPKQLASRTRWLKDQLAALTATLTGNYALQNGSYPNLRAQATTKADVDLGNVPNYAATNDASGGETTLLATARAVKDWVAAQLGARSVVAGPGLIGGGALTGAVTVQMARPDSITAITINDATDTGHTHAIASTASRASSSTTHLLQAAAMSQHVASDDHDGRYALRARTVAAGAGLSGGGALTGDVTLAHADTSAAASVNGAGGVVLQDLALDGFGHVTAHGTVDLDGRYLRLLGGALTGGLEFLGGQAPARTDFSRHVALHPGYGLSVAGDDLNVVAGEGGLIAFLIGGAVAARIDPGGPVAPALGTLMTREKLAAFCYTQAQVDALLAGRASVTSAAGAGLTGGGTHAANRTIAHADTSTAPSANNAGGVVLQDLTLDGFGHVTGHASVDLDARFAPLADAWPGVYGGSTSTVASYPGGTVRGVDAGYGALANAAVTVSTNGSSFWIGTGLPTVLSGTWRAAGNIGAGQGVVVRTA